jgi:hypothetical protein
MRTLLITFLLAPFLLSGCEIPLPVPHSSLLAQRETHTALISRVDVPDRADSATPVVIVVHVRREMPEDQIDAANFRAEVTPATRIVRVSGHTVRMVAFANTTDPCAAPPSRSQGAEETIRIPLALTPGTYSVQIPDFNHPEVATRSLVVN